MNAVGWFCLGAACGMFFGMVAGTLAVIAGYCINQRNERADASGGKERE